MPNELNYWDSCIFIRYLLDAPKNEKEALQLDNIRPLVQAAAKNEILVVVSTLVLAEVRPLEAYNNRHWEIVHDLFYRGRKNILVRNVTPVIAELAARWGAAHRELLTTPDAIHAATALLDNVTVMYTLDGDSNIESRRSGKLLSYDGKLTEAGRTVRIEVPPAPPAPESEQPSLFDSLEDEKP